MTGILDQLRNWTPERGVGRSDFDDDVKRPYRSRVARESIRIIKGATDLRNASPAQLPTALPGMSDTRPFAEEQGQPSAMQRALIVKLVRELIEIDPGRGADAAAYTRKMTDNAAWRDGNTARWIDTLETALRHGPKVMG